MRKNMNPIHFFTKGQTAYTLVKKGNVWIDKEVIVQTVGHVYVTAGGKKWRASERKDVGHNGLVCWQGSIYGETYQQLLFPTYQDAAEYLAAEHLYNWARTFCFADLPLDVLRQVYEIVAPFVKKDA